MNVIHGIHGVSVKLPFGKLASTQHYIEYNIHICGFIMRVRDENGALCFLSRSAFMLFLLLLLVFFGSGSVYNDDNVN